MRASLRSLSLFVPSRIELILACLVIGIVTVTLVTPSLYKGSDFETYFNYIENNPTKLQTDYENLSDEVNDSPLAADVSVFGLWAVAGLAGYGIVESFIGMYKGVKKFDDELDYTNTDKSAFVLESLGRLGARLIAVALLYLLATIFFTNILPFILLLAHDQSATNQFTIAGVLTMIGLIIFLVFHFAVVLLRLVFLRTRLFFAQSD